MRMKPTIVFSVLSLAGLFFSAPSLADHQAYAVSVLENSYSPLNRTFLRLIGSGDLKGIETLIRETPNIDVADGKGVRLVHYAAYSGGVELLSLLRARGADIKAATVGGWTTLHYAAHGGHLAMVRELVDKGVPIEARDVGGETPLFYAVEAGRVSVVQWLVGAGADVNNGNNQEETPLDVAIATKNAMLVDLLKKAGAKTGAAYKPGGDGHD